MSDMSIYLGHALAAWMKGTTFPAALSNIYIGLFNGNPKTTGTEVTTTIRGAGRIVGALDTLSGGSDNTLANVSDSDFGSAAGGTTVDYVGIFDAASAGNLLFSRVLPGGPFTIVVGAPVKFLAGDLTFTLGSAT